MGYDAQVDGMVNSMTTKLLAARRNDRIQVGFVEGQMHVGGRSVSEIAETLSFGTDDIPARPFLEEGIASKQEVIQDSIESYYKSLIGNEPIEQKLANIGAQAVGAIQEFVRGDHYQSTIPNAPSTIARKSKKNGLSDKPLIDTGQMINSVTYVVNGKVAK